jgi:hypothetical protein
MNPLARIQGKEKIALIDHYAETPSKIAHDLDQLAVFLSENEETVFRCTCEDDDEHPRGYMEYDTNAYIHADDCPSGWPYHYQVLLRGLARHFRED